MGVWDGCGPRSFGAVGLMCGYVSVGVWDGCGPSSLWECGMDVGLDLCVRVGWMLA